LVLLVLVPAIDALLNLDSLLAAAVVAAASVPLTMAGGQAGILQGERRWGSLALFYLAGGLPRLVVGTALILWRPSATTAILGVGIGYLFPLMVGWWALRHRREAEAGDAGHSTRAMLVETAHNAQVLFAYFALSSVDIILARQVLNDHDAGLYAAGLIMSKVMLFLPQFVIVLAFPDMATAEHRQRALVRSLAAITGVGAVAVVASKLLAPVALVFVGGSAFVEVEELLWVFAALGTVLAMLQLQVYAVLARQGRRSTVLVWIALGALVVLGLQASSVAELVTSVVAVDTVLLVLLTLASLRIARRAPAPPVAAAPPA
jgi:O-antigen/teichoic acid export membrane protein